MTYDTWKTTNPDDEFLGPELPPCEWKYAHKDDHPRSPSGWCVICAAPPESGCRHPLAVGEEAEE
jgi:hypothetical protein